MRRYEFRVEIEADSQERAIEALREAGGIPGMDAVLEGVRRPKLVEFIREIDDDDIPS